MMSLVPYNGHVQDDAGNSAPGAEIYVRDADTLDLADLFDDDEVTPVNNPFTTDNLGDWYFKVAAGNYSIEAIYLGRTRTVTEVALMSNAVGAGITDHVLPRALGDALVNSGITDDPAADGVEIDRKVYATDLIQVTASYQAGSALVASQNDGISTSRRDYVRNTLTEYYEDRSYGYQHVSTPSRQEKLHVDIAGSGERLIRTIEPAIERVGYRWTTELAGGTTLGIGATDVMRHYEKGGWAPTLTSVTAYSAQIGSYVRIGDMVYARFFVWVSAFSAVGAAAHLGALPFVPAEAGAFGVSFGEISNIAFADQLSAQSSGSAFALIDVTQGAGASSVLDTAYAGNLVIAGVLIYEV